MKFIYNEVYETAATFGDLARIRGRDAASQLQRSRGRARRNADGHQPPNPAPRGILRQKAVPPATAPARADGRRSKAVSVNSERLPDSRGGALVVRRQSRHTAPSRYHDQRIREPLAGSQAEALADGTRRRGIVDHWGRPGGEARRR